MIHNIRVYLIFLFLSISHLSYGATLLIVDKAISESNIQTFATDQNYLSTDILIPKVVKDDRGSLLLSGLELTEELLDKYITPSIKQVYLSEVTIGKGFYLAMPDQIETLYAVDSRFGGGLNIESKLLKNFTIKNSSFSGSFYLLGNQESKETKFNFSNNEFNCKKGFELVEFKTIHGLSLKMEKNQFQCEVSMMDLLLSNWVNITGSLFNDGFTLINNKMPANFDFYFNTVIGPVFLPKIDFIKDVSFAFSSFSDPLVLNGTKFLGQLTLQSANFKGGLDLQFTEFGKQASLFVAHMRVPNGELKLNINTFEKLINKELMNQKANMSDREKQLIYNSFISQFASQQKKQEADKIRYLFEVYKQQQDPKFNHWLYGITMGYGYKLWNYILVVVLPITLLCSLIMGGYYQRNLRSLINRIDQRNDKHDIKNDSITGMMRTLAITSSILFSIRFKTIWTSESKSFNRFIIGNYILGLLIYIAFLLGTKTSSFDVIKSLSGV